MRKANPERPYHSPIRQQQAGETRRRIAEAARKFLREQGYAGTTMDTIAREARAAPQTVYAIFQSKRGILAEILRRAAFGPAYRGLVEPGD